MGDIFNTVTKFCLVMIITLDVDLVLLYSSVLYPVPVQQVHTFK